MDGLSFLNGQELQGQDTFVPTPTAESSQQLQESHGRTTSGEAWHQNRQSDFSETPSDFKFYEDLIKSDTPASGPAADLGSSQFFASSGHASGPTAFVAPEDQSHHQSLGAFHSAAPSPFVEASQFREHPPQSTASSASFLTDNGWDDQDLMFTPLLSPAITNATSAFSPAVSTSNHRSTTDPSHILSSQSGQHDPFSPLTSPALRPQNGGHHQQPQQHPPPLAQQHLAALMNGIDMSQVANFQAQAAAAFVQGQRQILQSLGLGHLVDSPAALTALLQQSALAQQHQQHGAASQPMSSQPSSTSSQAMADQLPPPRDPAYKPSKGRGASRTSSKARPSPIMRPHNTSSGASSNSKGTNAANSPHRVKKAATTAQQSAPPSAAASPMFPPSVFSSNGPQPMSHLSLNESPSPIDLTAMFKASPASSSHGQPSSQHFAPITPSTLMNLPDDVSMLHGLSPVLHPVPEQQNEDISIPQSQQQQQKSGESNGSQKPSREDTIMPAPTEKRSLSRKSSATKPVAQLPSAISAGVATAAAAAKNKGKAKAKAADSEDPADKKQSHKNAEQRRRDSLKECFEELRHLLPHIPPEEDEEAPKRPGEGNIGGQRHVAFDPEHPNKGVSKVALLRKSNEYLKKLHGRIERRDKAIEALRTKLNAVGLELDDAEFEALQGFSSLDTIDEEEYGAWPFPKVDSDELDIQQLSRSRRGSGIDVDT